MQAPGHNKAYFSSVNDSVSHQIIIRGGFLCIRIFLNLSAMKRKNVIYEKELFSFIALMSVTSFD